MKNSTWGWVIGIALLLVLAYFIQNILMPFVIGLLVAYSFNPLVNKLENIKIPRTLSALLVILIFLSLIGSILFFAIPFLSTELIKLAKNLPEYGERLLLLMTPIFDTVTQYIGTEDIAHLQETAKQHIGEMFNWGFKVLTNVLTGGLALANLLSLIIITPFVAFYLLRDWQDIAQTTQKLIPKKYTASWIELTTQIHDTLGGFIKGQATLCLILAIIYSIGLSLVNLDYAITIGIFTGLLAFIPYVGVFIGVSVGLGMAFAQFEDWTSIVLVAIVFFVGQIIEGSILAPMLVGDRVGLHPVWMIFALLAAGTLFGFVGLLFAVPIAALIGVLVRFSYKHYMQPALAPTKKPAKLKSKK